MPKKRSRRGFTWIELAVILVILAVLLSLLIPAILKFREDARRTKCIDNLKQIGLGLHAHHDTLRRFPGSAEMVGPSGEKKVGGWSFLYKTLPYNGYPTLYNGIVSTLREGTLADSDAVDPLTHSDSIINVTRNATIPLFLCPSNPNKTYEDPSNKQLAFTNYKAMGGTCMESLMLCEKPNGSPPYGDTMKEPDGGLFPTNKGIRLSDILDGTADTAMVVETLDDAKSCWIAGADATLVGMPKVKYYQRFNGSFWSPLDYVKYPDFYDLAGPEMRAARTYLAFDFRPGYKDAGSYPSGIGRTPNYGPSSAHSGVVNHLMYDGSVWSIRKDVDYAVYFFTITRNNGDPYTGPQIP
jgi:type II secretory pathway pseudopilin PulG